ncbi:MAG: iron ABC transporter permease [Mogibacterium sp.]|nr:iron ABC transporter permease [Mogibacterium sp.]
MSLTTDTTGKTKSSINNSTGSGSRSRGSGAGRSGRLPALWKIILIIMPFAAALIALGIGRMQISPGEVLEVLRLRLAGAHASSTLIEKTVMQLRLPRILLAALVGAGLSVSGCAFQSLFANPLATPDTLGVASGASFGAALGILMGFGLVGVQLTGLAMGGAAVTLTWLAGSGRGRDGLSYIVLSGIMIGSLFSALVSLIKYVADEESQLPAITYWLMGGLDKANYHTLSLGAPVIIAGILLFSLIRWRMNLLPLTDDEAKASGVDIRLLRAVTIISATAVTASCVSMCGQVGWVGLLIPHMCRMIFGNNHLSLIPASVSLGAVFMIAVDTAARSISAAEIPVSILTAIIGAPFFIMLMRRSGGWRV